MAKTKMTARKSVSSRYFGRRLASRDVEPIPDHPVPDEPEQPAPEEEEEDPEERELVPEEEEEEDPEERVPAPEDVEKEEEPKKQEPVTEYRKSEKFRSYGEGAGFMGQMLKDLLFHLGIKNRPLYISKKVLRHGMEEWISQVTIFDGEKVMGTHHCLTHRGTRGAAEADAAWRAITSMRHTHDGELDLTPFTYLPMRKPGQDEYTTAALQLDVTIAEMATMKGTVRELSKTVASLWQENRQMRKRLHEGEAYLRAHIRVRRGETSDLYWSNVATYTADSPPPEDDASHSNVDSTADDATSRT